MGFERSFVDGLRDGQDMYFRARDDNRAQESHDIGMRGKRRADDREQRAYEMDTGAEDGSAPQAGGLKSPRVTPMRTGESAEAAGSAPMGGVKQAGGLPAPGQPQTAESKATPPNPYDDQLSQAEFAMRRARILGDQKGYEAAFAQTQQLKYDRTREEGARIANSMSEQEFDAYLDKETRDPAHPMRVFKQDGSKDYVAYLDGHRPVTLSRAELVELFSHDYAGKNGYATQAAEKAGGILAKLRGENQKITKENAAAAAGLQNADSNTTNARSMASQVASMNRQRNLTSDELGNQMDRREQAAKLQEAFDALTPEQQNGAEGNAIRTKFNMLNIRNGAQLGLAGKGGAGSGSGALKRAVDQKQNDDGSFTAFDKQTGEALYNTYHGMTLPLGTTVSEYNKLRQDAVKAGVEIMVGESNGRIVFGFVGPSGDPQPTLEAARASKPGGKAGKPSAGQGKQGGLAPRKVDADGDPVPQNTREAPRGYGVPDARPALQGLLRTPSYSGAPTKFNPD